MPQDRPPTLLQRSALGLWFFALGALGLLRYFMRHARDPNAASDTVMQLWLAGSVVVGVLGAWLLLRAFAAYRSDRRHR